MGNNGTKIAACSHTDKICYVIFAYHLSVIPFYILIVYTYQVIYFYNILNRHTTGLMAPP